jgi:hypothetical protein
MDRSELERQKAAEVRDRRKAQPGAVAVPGIKLQRKGRKERRGKRATPRDAWSLALASAEEKRQQERERHEMTATNEEEDAYLDTSSDEEIMPGAVAVAGVFTGPRNRLPRHKTAKQQTDTPTPRDAHSSAFASAEEMSRPPELQRNWRQEREQREDEDASLDEEIDSGEEMKPGAVAVAGVFTSPTNPSILSESQGPSAREPSLIIAELAEPYQEDEELRRRMQELEQEDEVLRRRYQELERNISEAVTGTVLVENRSGGDHDETAATSPFDRKERGFLIGAAFALLLVVGVILGVTIPLTTNNDKNSPLIDSAVTPTQSPTPTEAQRRCTSLDCLAEILLQNEVSDAETLQDESSPQFLALRWLANNDPAVLDLANTPTVILVERYVLAVLYFATSAEGGWLNVLNFLSTSSVCVWNNGERGVLCNGDALVVALLLRKSKHEEVIVLISKFRIDSSVYFPFYLNR